MQISHVSDVLLNDPDDLLSNIAYVANYHKLPKTRAYKRDCSGIPNIQTVRWLMPAKPATWFRRLARVLSGGKLYAPKYISVEYCTGCESHGSCDCWLINKVRKEHKNA